MAVTDLVWFDLDYIFPEARCTADPDVAGIGVIISFTVAASVTTLCSVSAAVLDALNNDPDAIFPMRLRRILCRKQQSPDSLKRHRQRRAKLERFMLSMADQQLLTGYAILIAGLVRADDPEIWNRHPNPYPKPVTGEMDDSLAFPPSQLKYQNAHFMLILYLSCLSSSSHLACILTLKNYFAKHRDAIVSRLAFVYVFALLLSTMTAITLPFQPLRVAFKRLFHHTDGYCAPENEPCKSDRPFLDDDNDVSRVLPILYLIFVMYPFLLLALHLPIMGISRIRFRERFLDFVSIKRVRSAESDNYISANIIYLFRDCFALACRYIFVGSLFIVFCQQIAFFAVSLVFVYAQRFAEAPDWDPWNAYGSRNSTESSWGHYCSLNLRSANKWGFGQILPMILLFQPALTAIGSFQDVGKQKEMPPQESLAQNISASFPPQHRRRPDEIRPNENNVIIGIPPSSSLDNFSIHECADGDLALPNAHMYFAKHDKSRDDDDDENASDCRRVDSEMKIGFGSGNQ